MNLLTPIPSLQAANSKRSVMLTDFAHVAKAVPALDFGFKLYETVGGHCTPIAFKVPETIWNTIPSKIP